MTLLGKSLIFAGPVMTFCLATSAMEQPPAAARSAFDETVAVARESIALTGLEPKQAAKRLQGILHKEYGYRLTCDDRYFVGLDGITCLAGTRALARFLYRAVLPALDTMEAGALSVRLMGSGEVEVDAGADEIVILMPATSLRSKWISVVLAVLLSDAYRKKVSVARAFAQVVDGFQANFTNPVEFDDGMTIAEKWRFIINFTDAVRADPRLLDRRSEKIRIGGWFRDLHEENLKLVENLNANASPDRLRDFLGHNQDSERAVREEVRVRELMGELTATRDHLRSRTGLNTECSGASDLLLRECLLAIRKLTSGLASRPGVRPLVRDVLIVGAGEMARPVDTFTDPGTGGLALAVRQDFDFPHLWAFLAAKGWTQ